MEDETVATFTVVDAENGAEDDGLLPDELERKARMEKNREKMKQLGIEDLVEQISGFVQPVKKEEKKRRKEKKQPKRPTRRSARIANLTKKVNYATYLDDDAFDPEEKAEVASVSSEDGSHGYDSSIDDGRDDDEMYDVNDVEENDDVDKMSDDDADEMDVQGHCTENNGGELKKQSVFEFLKERDVVDATGHVKEEGSKSFLEYTELCAAAIETCDWRNLFKDVSDAEENNDATKAEGEENPWVKWKRLVKGVKNAYSQELSETDLAALDVALESITKEHLKKILDELIKPNAERFERACGALVEEINKKIESEISAKSAKGGGEDADDVSMLSAVKVLEETLGVLILLPAKNNDACKKHNDERRDLVNCVCKIKHEEPPEKERSKMSNAYREVFGLKEEEGEKFEIQLSLKPVVVHVTNISSKARSGSHDTFVLGEDALKTIEDELSAGKMVIIDGDVLLATYPVGDEKSMVGKSWSLLRGRDCAKEKTLIQRIICEASRYSKYWKNLRPLLSTIARHKTKIVCDVLKKKINSSTEQFLFCSVHIDATSYIAPGGKLGEKLIQNYAKEDIARNTKNIVDTLLAAQAGFTIHVHSKWLFRDYLSNGPFRVKLAGDSIPVASVDASKSEIEGDEEEVLRAFLDTGSQMCVRGELSITDDSDDKRKISIYVSAHMSHWFHNGGYPLIVQKVSVALGGTSEKDDALKEFARAGAACSPSFILERLPKRFAEEVKSFTRANDEKPGTFNADLLGSKAFVDSLFNVFTNPEGFPKTAQAVRNAFGVKELGEDLSSLKSCLRDMIACVEESTKRDGLLEELAKLEAISPTEIARILQAQIRHKSICEDVMSDLTVFKIAHAAISATCRSLFEKAGKVGNTTDSSENDFFALYWAVRWFDKNYDEQGRCVRFRDPMITASNNNNNNDNDDDNKNVSKKKKKKTSGKFVGLIVDIASFVQQQQRKNPHPQRAVNARTVLKVVKSTRGEEEEEEEEEEEQPPVLCLKIPDKDEDVFESEQKETRKEKMYTTKKGKRKRGHECDVCEKVFDRPSNLTRHMRADTNEKPYECDVCEKRFSDSSGLKNHMRIHTNEKPYECDVCEKAFRESGTLQIHMRTHTSERPYECDVCEKRFSRSDVLKSHMRIHTKEKPYECHVCGKRYRQANGLKYHMRTQH